MVAASRFETSAAATETVCRAGLARWGESVAEADTRASKPLRCPEQCPGWWWNSGRSGHFSFRQGTIGLPTRASRTSHAGWHEPGARTAGHEQSKGISNERETR